jgi:hypothetical protein
MQIIRDPADADSIANRELRVLVQKTIVALSPDGPYDSDVLGYFLIVEPGDSLATIEAQVGFDILANRWTGIRFDQPGYTQAFEILAEHADWFELVFIVSDDGFGIEIFIPKSTDIPELLAMCQRYATPATLAVPAILAVPAATGIA